MLFFSSFFIIVIVQISSVLDKSHTLHITQLFMRCIYNAKKETIFFSFQVTAQTQSRSKTYMNGWTNRWRSPIFKLNLFMQCIYTGLKSSHNFQIIAQIHTDMYTHYTCVCVYIYMCVYVYK